MRALIACEFSGIVRDAFIAAGHDAVSCDLLPSERPGPHIQGDVRDILNDGWTLLIAHVPCTFLANSGVRWLYGGKGTELDPARWAAMREGADLFAAMLNAPIARIAVENPIMHRYGRQEIAARTVNKTGIEIQTVQPWQYDHPESKATQLWLRNLPPLVPTSDLRSEMAALPASERTRVHYASPGPDRWKERSRTLPGLGKAMAEQWGGLA